ncbi:hypothetical protein [Streptomyces sp. NPDC058108]
MTLGLRAVWGLPPPHPHIGLNGLVLKRRTGWVSATAYAEW